MATNENSTSQILIDSSSNHNMIDIPLYAESNMTRKQAIREITDVVLCANMKPRTVKYALQLLQKLLPVDNTLPATIDELFGAMMSSENDWRLAQYLMKHKQNPSFSPSSPNLRNEYANIAIQPASAPFDSHESSDDEDELTPYDRLQQCLRPITDLSRDFNLNYATSTYSNNPLAFDQTSQSTSDSVNSSAFLGSFKRIISETSSTASTQEQDSLYTRILAAYEDDTENETSRYSTTNEKKRLCCFEINGYDLLNGGKRRRYY